MYQRSAGRGGVGWGLEGPGEEGDSGQDLERGTRGTGEARGEEPRGEDHGGESLVAGKGWWEDQEARGPGEGAAEGTSEGGGTR